MPWQRKWQPTPVFLPGESHLQRSRADYSPWVTRVGHNLATKPPLPRRVIAILPRASLWASLVAQLVKNPPAVQETWVRSLGWEDSLEKGTTTRSSVLA